MGHGGPQRRLWFCRADVHPTVQRHGIEREDLAIELLGESRMERWNETFQSYVSEHEPEWWQVYRTLELATDPWLQAAFPEILLTS